jgi:hypothetical protein
LLSACRAVLNHSRALAAEVIADRMPLDSAIKQMQREREASSSIEARMDRLREQALRRSPRSQDRPEGHVVRVRTSGTAFGRGKRSQGRARQKLLGTE